MSSDGVHHPRGDLPSLTGLRLVAAGVVFFFHTGGYGDIASHWWRVTSLGYTGVGFFFVLSGVVLTWSRRPTMSAPQFWWRRIARIYPLTLLTTVVAVFVYEYAVPRHKPLWPLPLVVTLLHAWVPSQLVQSDGNGVTWSLSCEAFFYLVFPVVVVWLARRHGSARWLPVGMLVAACSTAALVFAFVANGRWDVIAYEEPPVRLGEFVLGVALGLALREGWVPRLRPGTAWVAAGVAWLALLGEGSLVGWPVPRGLGDTVMLAPLVALIVAYSGADLAGERTRMASRSAVYLGQVSFAFYLVHQVVLDVITMRVTPNAHPGLGWAFGVTACGLAVSLLLAVVLHHAVERPAQRALLRPGRAAPAGAGVASAPLPVSPGPQP